MKKIYNIFRTLILLTGMVSFQATAQLSGVYTINSGASASATNFTSFTTFAAALNTQGVSAPVIVNVVAAAPAYTEQVTFTQAAGMSSSNRVIINGNGNTLTYTATVSTAPHTLLLNGTDYMTVNNLNVVGGGAVYAMVCILTNAANYNYFNGCTFTAPPLGTVTGHCAFSISGTATSPAGTGNSGDYNTVKSCTLSNGYYSFTCYGGSAILPKYNSLIDSKITDFYAYGPYFRYTNYFTMRNCTVDRATRTTSGTVYVLYTDYNNNCMIDGNKIEKIFNAQPGATSTIYFYMYFQALSGVGRNTFRNNIITDIKSNGTVYMYQYGGAWDIHHNTFDWDYAGGSHTGTLYNCYAYGDAVSGPINIYNNIITLRKPGAGTRYGIYTGGNVGYTNIDKNNIVPGVGAGGNYVGYYTAAAANLAAWQTQGRDLNGFSVDPVYTSATDLHPTATAINNMGMPMGVVFDQEKMLRNPTTPDIGALEFLTPLCTGTSTSSITTPTYALCPNEITTIGVSPVNTSSGMTYAWSASQTSNVGPFNVPIPTSTNEPFLTTIPATVPTWYQVVMTCTNPGGGTASPVGQVLIAGNTTTTVPYYEGFETINANNRLPNCSWSSNSLGNAAQTFTSSASGNRVARTGSSYATFENATPGTNYYYSNSISMTAGITYSAAIHYATDYLSNANWTLSLLVGPNQSPTGMVQIATAAPAVSGIYKLLGNTFTIPTTGLYYIAIQAISSAGTAKYLSLDDMSITVPCNTGTNSIALLINASTTTVCAGNPVTLSASGATNYNWLNNSAATSNITENPYTSTTYTVIGSNPLTSCSATMTQYVQVKQNPNVIISASSHAVCSGSPVSLTANNADSYVWSNASTNNFITVNPTSTTIYSVTGMDANGCSATAVTQISVNALPVIMPSGPAAPCKGEAINLSATGAANISWQSASLPLYQGNPITVVLTASTIFTVTGTDANGCTGIASLTQGVAECTGLNEISSGTVRIYPNPTAGEFVVELNNSAKKIISVTDLMGRIISTYTSNDETIHLNINELANGIYYVKIQSNESLEVVKIVKQ